MSIHCSEPGITSGLLVAPALFFFARHLVRRRRLRHPRGYYQQIHKQHTNSVFRHGFISSALQVLTFL
jgi:hypothetical protein